MVVDQGIHRIENQRLHAWARILEQALQHWDQEAFRLTRAGSCRHNDVCMILDSGYDGCLLMRVQRPVSFEQLEHPLIEETFVRQLPKGLSSLIGLVSLQVGILRNCPRLPQ
ncbi:protein of unknown function [Cyanobium sp. NIES-981]|nr:protein of unknown function [Cyanobium sp. NIES-981]